jgi:ABC-type bacteriocin/lantibiotic exporter with double-glycine peptidase domain
MPNLPINKQETPTDRPLTRFIRLLSLDKSDILSIFIYSVFGGVITLTIPLGIQAIINLIAMQQATTSWMVLIFVVALGTAIAGSLRVLQFIITEILQRRIFTRSAFEFAYRIPKLRIERIKDQYAPELANRFFDTLSIQKGMPKVVLDFSDSILQIFFGLVLLALYHPFFVAFGVVMIILLLTVILATGGSGLRSSLKESKYKYKVAFWLEELGRTMGSFKLAGRTKYHLDKTDDLVDGYIEYRTKHFSVLRLQLISIVTLKTLATGALLLIGGWLVIANEINIGQFVASEIMIIIVLNSLEKIIMSMETIFDLLTAVEKIGAVADLELESEEGMDFKEINTHPQGMAIKMVDLSYHPESSPKPILKNLNLEIAPGERVAICGTNGSGKTTLLKVLLGLYQDTNGVLTYNGIPRGNINVASLRSFMGDHVSEEYLFQASLAKNISMGREEVSLSMIVSVCEKVGLMEFVQSLPEGLDTIIPSDGEGLPQSVIRKIILARCIVDSPRFVAVEPILNNLNHADKLRLMQLLLDKKAPWTLVAVTYNSQLARRCDKIVVLDKGEIIFQGKYEELKQQPYFKDLFDDVFECDQYLNN